LSFVLTLGTRPPCQSQEYFAVNSLIIKLIKYFFLTFTITFHIKVKQKNLNEQSASLY